MRIDEFKATPSGTISATDQTRFLLFGFDLTINTGFIGVIRSVISTAAKLNPLSSFANKFNVLNNSGEKNNDIENFT